MIIWILCNTAKFYVSRVGHGEHSKPGPLRDRKLLMYYVYLLNNQTDKSWYIGMTENLDERLKRHNAGDGARTTSRKEGWKPIYFEAYLNKNDALGREKFLKSGSGRRYIKKQLRHYLEAV